MTVLEQPPAAPATALASPPAAADAHRALRDRLERAKHAYSTRNLAAHLRRSEDLTLLTGAHRPRAGEVVLARVTAIGQHTRLEGPASRRGRLFVGDEILVAYGSRYAADQFHALLPEDLGPCQLVAAGGLASRVVAQHAAMSPATEIEPIGVLADADGPITLARAAAHRAVPGVTERPDRPGHRVPVIVVLGTSMNAGKSTVLAMLAHGLAAAGLQVAAGKATGTGAGNDAHLFADAGAHRVLDFTDFGLPSTYGLGAAEIRDLFASMVDELAAGAAAPDVVLMEIADGVYQGETARLLADPAFADVVDLVVLAAADALGAVGGLHALQGLGISPALVSGRVTASPLAAEEARRAVEVPVVDTFALGEAATAREVTAGILGR